ncbi:hypothetical protein GIB67_002053 [Kingdonia uniflora]|uniref:Uncharacterized protein n=1 Tax=Kingdonia uniflora TaxID=39325 RepID=A0A7J7KWF8_9MAGN|nr:hypothetical protein GIB67_002053 [Kingdonia uniflora]
MNESGSNKKSQGGSGRNASKVCEGAYFQYVVAAKYDGGMDSKFEFTKTGNVVFSGYVFTQGGYVELSKKLSLPLGCTLDSTQMKELQLLLSQFSYKPKPIIEDMSIQTNVPALAIEEIAPVTVSNTATLAPEEVFTGKADIKEEMELTQEQRKQKRANKKRKFKGMFISVKC